MKRTVHVLFRKEDLDTQRVKDKIVIVLDILFATTSIVSALYHGISRIFPAKDIEEAHHTAQSLDVRCLLAGEYMFQLIEGFAPPTPLALNKQIDNHDTLVYTTTNGTVALRNVADAKKVLIGALLNASVIARTAAQAGSQTILIQCAGTAGAFNLEDFYGAGCIIDRLLNQPDYDWNLTDASQAALGYYRGNDATEILHQSFVGQLMAQHQLQKEVDFATQQDSHPLVAELTCSQEHPAIFIKSVPNS